MGRHRRRRLRAERMNACMAITWYERSCVYSAAAHMPRDALSRAPLHVCPPDSHSHGRAHARVLRQDRGSPVVASTSDFIVNKCQHDKNGGVACLCATVDHDLLGEGGFTTLSTRPQEGHQTLALSA